MHILTEICILSGNLTPGDICPCLETFFFETFFIVTTEGFYGHLVGHRDKHPTMHRPALAQRTNQPQMSTAPEGEQTLTEVLPKTDTHAHLQSQGLVGGSSGHSHVTASKSGLG